MLLTQILFVKAFVTLCELSILKVCLVVIRKRNLSLYFNFQWRVESNMVKCIHLVYFCHEKNLLSQLIRLQIEIRPILTWSVVLIAAIFWVAANALVTSKPKHSLSLSDSPGISTFEDWLVLLPTPPPPLRQNNCIQMPHSMLNDSLFDKRML